jgi:dienelactone hydrolase
LIVDQGITLPRPLKYDTTVSVLRYKTQDRGVIIEATAAIARPSNVPADAPALPVLALLHGTSGFRDGCGASKALEYQGLAAAFASMGFFVIIPDYLGLKANGEPTGFPHPYLGGIPTAIASLDAVRTAYRLPDDLIEGSARPSQDLVIVGGSQGGHAALWVDRLAPYYASEFNLRGIVATVPPADLLTESTLALSAVRSSTANSIAVMSTLPAWYGAEGKIGEWLKEPIATQAPAILAATCEPTDEQKKIIEGYSSLDEVFQPAVLDAAKAGTLADVPTLGCIVSENGLTSTTIARKNPPAEGYGLLWILGEKDTLVDTPTERASFETLCKGGMPMTFLECAGASHTQATSWSLPEIATFLFERLDGKPFTPSCKATAPSRCKGTPADK